MSMIYAKPRPSMLAGGAEWTPLKLSPTIWVDASQISGLSDDDPIGTWTDLSGNNYHFVQATESKKPLFKTGIINGLPVIRFDLSDDIMAANGGSAIFPSRSNGFALVLGNVTNAMSKYAFGLSRFSASIDYDAIAFQLRTNNATKDQTFGFSGGGGAYSIVANHPVDFWVAQYHILINYNDGSNNGYLRLDGVNFTNDTEWGGAPSYDPVQYNIIGMNPASGALGWDCAEYIYFNTQPSVGNLQLLEEYWSDKYSISIP